MPEGTFSKKSADIAALHLVDSGHHDEFLVCREGVEDATLAVAVIRTETGGVYAYPHQVPYRRLGPFDSPEDALESCRSEIGEAPDGSPIDAVDPEE